MVYGTRREWSKRCLIDVGLTVHFLRVKSASNCEEFMERTDFIASSWKELGDPKSLDRFSNFLVLLVDVNDEFLFYVMYVSKMSVFKT